MAGSKIGRINPATGELKEFTPPTPAQGARRIMPDPRTGIVWFTEFNAGKIGSFDPQTEKFAEYPIATPNAQPYAIFVDGQAGVWFSEFAANKLGRLDAGTGRIEEWELPSRGTGCRTLIADAAGTIWCPGSGVSKLLRFGG